MRICKIQPPKSPCFPAGTYAGVSIGTSQAGTCLVFPKPQLLNFSKCRKNVSLPFTASSESRRKVWRHELIAQELIKSCGAWFSLESLGLALPQMQLSSVSPFPFILELHTLILQVGREKMSTQVNLQTLAPLGGNNLLKGVEAKSPSAASSKSLRRAGKGFSLATSLGAGPWYRGVAAAPARAVSTPPAAPSPYPTAQGLLSTHQGLSWLGAPALKTSIPFPVGQSELPYTTTITNGCVGNAGPLFSSQLRNIFTFQAMETLSCSRRVSGAPCIWFFRDAAATVLGKQERGFYHNKWCGPCSLGRNMFCLRASPLAASTSSFKAK